MQNLSAVRQAMYQFHFDRGYQAAKDAPEGQVVEAPRHLSQADLRAWKDGYADRLLDASEF